MPAFLVFYTGASGIGVSFSFGGEGVGLALDFPRA